MNEKILDLAINFKNAIIKARNNGEKIGILKYFPNGCCDTGSYLLSAYLISKNIQPKIINGVNKENNHHVVLLIDNCILDITAEQFQNLKNNEKLYEGIYYGEPDNFYNQYKFEEECLPLSEDEKMIYYLILKYLD